MSDVVRPQNAITETIVKIQIDGKELFKDRAFSKSWVV